jgi:predicted transcriptional regulator of viral defense system
MHYSDIIMMSTITGLSPREAEFLARLSAEDRRVFRLADIADGWPDATAARRALSRLERGGWLKRIERGLYMLVPLSAGPERVWSEDALVIGARLVTPSAIAYWSALRFWNLTEQIPATVFVQSPQRKLARVLTLDGVRYRIVKIAGRRFFGLTERAISGQNVPVAGREKTVADCADRPELCGGAWQLAQALRDHWSEFDWPALDETLARFASGAVYKRLGYLIEALDLPITARGARLADWRQRLTAGIALLDPDAGAAGPVRTRWRIRDNIGLVQPDEDQGV